MFEWFTRLFQPKQNESRSSGTIFAPQELYETIASSAGVELSERSCLGVSPLYRALDIIASKAAGLERDVVLGKPGGTKTKNYNHPVYQALNYWSAPLYPASSLIHYLFWCAVLHGNGLGYIRSRNHYDYGIDPHTTVLRYIGDGVYTPTTPDGGGQRSGPGWYYQATCWITRDDDIVSSSLQTSQVNVTGARSEIIYIPLSEMLHLKSGIGNMLVGYSLLSILADALGEQVGLQQYSTSVFGNDSHLKTVVELPAGFDGDNPENVERFRRMWNEKHRGPRKASTTALLEQGSKAYNLGINNEAIQWATARGTLSPQVVAQLTGVPVHLLGNASGSSQYKNEEEKTASFLQFTMAGWLDRFEAEARMKLFTEKEKDSGNVALRFNRAQLIQHDIQTLDQIAQAKFLSGRMTLNEYLAQQNIPGIGEDGDQRYLPTTVQLMDDVIDPPDPPAPILPPGAAPGATGAPADKPADKAKDATAKRLISRISKSVQARSKRKDWTTWLQNEFISYHESVLTEGLSPFLPDADVIVDEMLHNMQEELSAILSEQRSDMFAKYLHEIRDTLHTSI